MKLLTLYIDKWYIIGSYCVDGVVTPVPSRTGEDRFWLFFYEDRELDVISYGLANKRLYYCGTPLYYGDVFAHITDSQCCFQRYGRKVSFSEIFQESGILSELREAVSPLKGNIPISVAFSADISPGARFIFLQDVLKLNGFEVQQFSGHIEFLSLEHTFKGLRIQEDGYYLVLNACNENLYYSLYQRKDASFFRLAADKLDGLGTDPRRRALVEDVVRKINQTQHFVKDEEGKESEYCNLLQDVDSWLSKIDHGRSGVPVLLSNVRLSCVPNAYSVSVLKSEIDRRTETIVEAVMRVIIQFLQQQLPADHSIKGVLMLGDAFSNQQYTIALETKLGLSSEKYVHIPLSEISRVIAVYEHIDRQRFSTEEEKTLDLGAAELADLQHKRAERAELEEAERQLLERRNAESKLDQDERKYKAALDNVYDFEKKRDYREMKEWATIALSLKPSDEEAQLKLEEATRFLSEMTVRNEQYNNIIHRAQQSYDAQDWQDVLSLCDAALNLRPDSNKAISMREGARRYLDNISLVEKYLTRADLFLAQRSYKEAMEELDKVLLLDAQHKEAILKKGEIQSRKQELDQYISKLSCQLQEAEAMSDYDQAIVLAQQLSELDAESLKWRDWMVRLISAQQHFNLQKQRWGELKIAFDASLHCHRWKDALLQGEELLTLCEEEHIFTEDVDTISRRLKYARAKLDEEVEEEHYQKELLFLKSLMAEHCWDEANKYLRKMKVSFPEHSLDLKPLFTQILEAEESEVMSKSNSSRGVDYCLHKDTDIAVDRSSISSAPEDDDFFADYHHSSRSLPQPKLRQLHNDEISRNLTGAAFRHPPLSVDESKSGDSSQWKSEHKSASFLDADFFDEDTSCRKRRSVASHSTTNEDSFFDD